MAVGVSFIIDFIVMHLTAIISWFCVAVCTLNVIFLKINLWLSVKIVNYFRVQVDKC